MQVVAVVNRKGGVGKTTSAVNLASALALLGQRTLLVDLDPQGSAGRALGLAAKQGAGTSALFSRKAKAKPVYARHEALFRLAAIAADDDLVEVEVALLADASRRRRLRASLEALREHWAYVVIDTPPAHGGLGEAALRAADAVVVPAASDYLALESLQGTLELVRRAEQANRRKYTPLAILPTFVERRRSRPVGHLREQFGELVLHAEVPRSGRLESAALAGLPVALTAPDSAAAEAYRAAAEELLARAGRSARRHGRPIKAFARADMRDVLRGLRRA